jgi:hypothetical protein
MFKNNIFAGAQWHATIEKKILLFVGRVIQYLLRTNM